MTVAMHLADVTSEFMSFLDDDPLVDPDLCSSKLLLSCRSKSRQLPVLTRLQVASVFHAITQKQLSLMFPVYLTV